MEKMDDFFTARVDGYDSHMLTEVEGCKEAYQKMATLVPKQCNSILDLGCGTGLELDEIFRLLPDVAVTGIDLTKAMLDHLKEKHPDKKMNLICGSYFDEEFGISQFDCAISFQTMHHFSHEAKRSLYTRVHKALKTGGMYIECDYMVIDQKEEDFYYQENDRIRAERNIPKDAFYHYDTPCTIANQITLLKEAGFSKVEQVFRMENTTILIAYQ